MFETNMSKNRENLCWDFYIETISLGTPNAYKSAKKAGYSEDHARNITIQGWFKDKLAKLERKDFLSKSEKFLQEVLGLPHLDDKKKPIYQILQMKIGVAKHITPTLGKKVGYSTTIDEEREEWIKKTLVKAGVRE